MRTPINAAVLEQPGRPLRMTEVLLDEPAEHEVVVRPEHVGLCHSDLHYVKGALSIELPAVLGHEAVGVVEHVGRAVTRVAPGDRVVATVTPSCGICPSCSRGRPTQCTRVDRIRYRERPKLVTRQGVPVEVLGGLGAFAEAFLAGEGALAKITPDVPSSAACLLGCCITTGFGAAVHGAKITAEDTVAVIGCGGVGIAAVQGARIAGARRIVAIDAVGEKLGLARTFGATDVLLAGSDPEATVRQLKELVTGGVSHAIEAVGRAQTAELAFAILAPTGTATVLGLMPEGERLSIPADALVYGDRILRGAYMGANRFLSDVEMFTDHYRSGRLDLDSMVTAELPFGQINEGFAAMADPATIRIVLGLRAAPNRPSTLDRISQKGAA
ncbi:Zn-dependent alcohol dehydrogenase [Amycolatopsis panacis]|uniref:Zn-dependent alcohol dehydrogenase n=1 Tax=Amycolatopsis panacis TaxID=2340917 RepID=A0A419I7W0_9PSEU|nr:Zn-dependent alcohol dehydrogenase [Amycolatopsis panacis]RJQ87860.1 Zn-dependent alcohol dehydrogenase [Amycolatopsis panacis]